MTSRNVDAVVDRILAREGGPATLNDGAGLTLFGQTAVWLQDFGFAPPHNRDQAAANYRQFLALTHLEAVCNRDAELGDVVCDWAVNSGHRPAIRGLQSALGVLTDGVIGPETLTALATADAFAIRCLVIAARFDFLGDYFHDPAHAEFSRGLHQRVSAQVRQLGAHV
jgi:lysozyme family protein